MGIMGERLAKAQEDHGFLLSWTFLFGTQKDYLLFWVLLLWVLSIGRARHPGPGLRVFTLGELSIEFANVGGTFPHIQRAWVT